MALEDREANLTYPQLNALSLVVALMGGEGAQGFLEIRTLPPRSGHQNQFFVDASDADSIMDALELGWLIQNEPGYEDSDVYFGVAPRVLDRHDSTCRFPEKC